MLASREKFEIILINHLQNGGVGAAISTKFTSGAKIIILTALLLWLAMDKWTQMNSKALQASRFRWCGLCKGNRYTQKRIIGHTQSALSRQFCSIYFNKNCFRSYYVSDTQTGFTAISNSALNAIRIHDIYKSYGMPNDVLVKLNIAMCSLKEIPIKPVYDVGEKSKMKIGKVIPTVSLLLLRSFFKRLWQKYLFRDFHPLFLLYHLAILLFLFSLPLGIQIFTAFIIDGQIVTNQSLMIFVFLMTSAFQSLLFAMWMDIQDNERLYK